MRQHIACLAFLILLTVPAAAQESQYRVFFGFDSSRLDGRAEQVIEQAVATFRQTGSTAISAVGHTDTVGSEEYNQELSERRARSVADALVARGVPRDVIVIAGRGERELAVQTGEGVREPQNRRVVITVAEPQQPVAAAPPPEPEPEPEPRDRLTFLIAPWYGMSLAEQDSGGWIGHNVGANLVVNYDAFDQIGIEFEQAALYDISEHGWGGRTAIGANYVGLSNLIDVGALGGEIFPYIGANFGGYYGGDAVEDGFFAGPEIGLRLGPVEAKIAYDILLDEDWDDGIVAFTLGYGIRF